MNARAEAAGVNMWVWRVWVEGKASLDEITTRWSVVDLAHACLALDIKQATWLSMVESVAAGIKGAGK